MLASDFSYLPTRSRPVCRKANRAAAVFVSCPSKRKSAASAIAPPDIDYE